MRFSGNVYLRPVRLGLLVPPDDIGNIRRFMRFCTCMWGGRFNPIIPIIEQASERWKERFLRVPEELEITRGYVDFFEPDVLVEVLTGSSEKLGWKDNKGRFDLPRVLSLDELSKADDLGRWDFRSGIDIREVFAELYDTVYQFERRHKANYAFFDPTADGGSFFEAVGGTYPNDEVFQRLVAEYREVFDPEELPASLDTYRKMIEAQYRGPLWLTRHSLEEHQRDSRDPTIFIFDPSDGQDLIDYWNFALFTAGAFPMNIHWLPDFATTIEDYITKNYRPLPGNPHGVMIHPHVLCGRSISTEKSDALYKQYFAGVPKGSYIRSFYDPIWLGVSSQDRLRNSKSIAIAHSASYDEEVDEKGYVRIPAPAPTFRNKTGRYRHHTYMNVIQPGNSHRGDDRTATILPGNLWDPVYPNRLVTSDPLTITREGWVGSHSVDIGYSLLEPLTGRDAFIGWLKHIKDITATPSDAGQTADEIISAAGNLSACGMFADTQTLELLNEMAGSFRERKKGAREFQSKEPDRAKHFGEIHQHFSKREKRTWAYWGKLDYFLQRSVFRAGLRIKCPKCGFYNWFDLPALDYSLTCTRCLKLFHFDQSPGGLKSAKWFYRVVGPFATPDFARGGYAVALALRCLIGRHHDRAATWTTGLNFKELDCEIDFALWITTTRTFGAELSERNEPVLLLGEAKSFGKDAFDQNDVDTLKRIGEHFPSAVLVVATLKTIDQFTDDERSLIGDLIKWGRSTYVRSQPRSPIMVLTGTELLIDNSIEQAWEKTGGKAAQFAGFTAVDLGNPYELAELTQQLYFDMPSYHDDWENRRKAASEPSAAVGHS